MTTYTTPGVFVEEISTFPPSVVAVETAVPVFIGYTEKAVAADGTSLDRVPTRIGSLLDFETRYGGDFRPASWAVQLDTTAGNAIGTVTPRDASDTARRYYLYCALRQYFANGGGPCYVVSVGVYPAQPVLGSTTTGLRGGLEVIRSLDAPTLIVFPDGVSLSGANLGALQVAALAQCADLQDRFTIMDLRDGNAAPAIGADPAQGFRNNVGTSNLRYGAAYYPWLQTIYRPEVHFRDLAFVTPANAAIADATIDGLLGPAESTLVTALRAADVDAASIVAAVDVSGWTGAPVALDRRTINRMSAHYEALTAAIRVAGVPPPIGPLREATANLVILARALALALRVIEADAANLAPEINQTVASLGQDTGLRAAVNALIALEKHASLMPIVAAGRSEANVTTDYAALDGTSWILPSVSSGVVGADVSAIGGADQRETALNAAAAIRPHFDVLAGAVVAIYEVADFISTGAEARLFNGHPVMRAARDRVIHEMSLVPPSGAVAGVFAAVDAARGVWHAPANVSLTEVLGPVVKVNDAAQGRLNVHSTGKSVNAIRAFTGQGTLVWGARTLAGNDNEWRYINVRRFFNMAEESIRKATEPFTFEPNVAGTWVRVKSMIENFLTVQWRQGALMGATTDQAFFVKVGLGQTMTAEDILEGRMIVEVGMAVVRPAEFIVLKFAHKMQES